MKTGSVEELALVNEGNSAEILYSPKSGTIFLASSYQRQLRDNVYILLLPGLLFLIGILCWIFMQKLRVHAHEGTLYEYVTDESGKIVLDDARNDSTRSLRNYATLSKLFGLFDR